MAALAVLTLLALGAYLFLNRLLVADIAHQSTDRAVYKTLVYVAWLGVGFILFSAVFLTARKGVLAAVSLVSLVSISTNYAYDVISRKQLTPDLMEWMVHEVSQFSRAWAEFRPEIVLATLQAIVGLGVFFLTRALIKRMQLLPDRALLDSRARRVALFAFIAFHAAAMLVQPSYTVAETNLVVFGVPALMTPLVQPGPVPAGADPVARAEKIVFVLDESIGRRVFADVVSRELKSVPAIDFGEAASTATCSAASNALLRWGLEQKHVGEAGYDPRKNPTIWGFAKAAGFRTTLIDGQSKGATQNFLSTGELALIDEFVPADVGVETDVRIASRLQQQLARSGKEFIFIIKRGSHFPYEQNYPETTGVADASKPQKYARSVSYATSRFFVALAKQSFARTFLIYTSDHGQNLDARAVHCSDEHHPDEYSVPLVVLTEERPLQQLFAQTAPRMRDRVSHLNIFPTLLYALGYSREWIEGTYGPTLAGPPQPYLTLNWHLPYPTKRKSVVEFSRTDHFPGRKTGALKADSHADAAAPASVSRP